MDKVLTSSLLLEEVRAIEDLEEKISARKATFTQTFGVSNANLLREALEQRKIADEASQYARDLIASPDLPDED